MGDEHDCSCLYSIEAIFLSIWVNTVIVHPTVECKSLCPMDVKFTETNGKASREFRIRQSMAPGRLHSAWLYSDQKQFDVVFCSAFHSLLSPLDWADGLQVTRATEYNITA